MEKVDKITRIKCVKRVDVELQRIFRGLMKKKMNFGYIWTVKNWLMWNVESRWVQKVESFKDYLNDLAGS